MSIEMWWGLAIGASLSFFISTVFFSTKYHEIYAEKVTLTETVRLQGDVITHLQQEAHPREWKEDGPMGVRVREQLYDKHPDLVRPGSEVIRIEDEGDIPAVPITYTQANPSPKVRAIAEDVERSMLTEGWRNQTGQGGETT